MHITSITTIAVRWNPLTNGQLKLNIDGSSLDNPGMSGIGEVFKNHNGNYLLGYYMHLPPTTPTMAELLALRYGLTITKANNFTIFVLRLILVPFFKCSIMITPPIIIFLMSVGH